MHTPEHMCMNSIEVSDHPNDFSLPSFSANIEPFACANDGEKNHGDPPNINLVLGRQTNLLPYSHNLEAELGLLIAGAGVSLANLKAMVRDRLTRPSARLTAPSVPRRSPASRRRWGARPTRTRSSSASSGSSTRTFSTHSLTFMMHS